MGIKKERGAKYLLKNIGLLTVSNFATKLLTFFLVPLYTNVLSTQEYGEYDLVHTTIQILIPFFMLKIDEAALRFAMDKNEKQQDVFSVSLRVTIIGSATVAILVTANHVFHVFAVLDQHWIYFIILYFLQANFNLVVMFVRGLGRVKDIAISGVIATAISIICNIVFLIPLHMGLKGYFLASIIGSFIHSLYLFAVAKCWRYIKIGRIDDGLRNRMITYSKPMIVNSVSWWINNASDRYIVTWFCGVGANGIYSVSYKIPSILSVLHSIFQQAWTISAVVDFDSEDKNGFFSNTYNSYNFLLVISCSFIMIFDKFLAEFLYANDFYKAWIYVPFLLISVVFLGLSGYIGGIFSAVKNTKMYARSTTIGAIVNTALNISLVHYIGPLGAAIATAIGYWAVWVIRIYNVKKYVSLRISLLRDYSAYALLVVQAIIVITIRMNFLLYSFQICIFFLLIILFRNELTFSINKIRRFIHFRING